MILAVLDPTTLVIHNITEIFKKTGIQEKEALNQTIEYLRSPSLKDIPFNKISSMLFAAIARKAAHGGMKKPPDRGNINDVAMISTLMPYCDAMFIDNICYNYLVEQPLCRELDYNTQLFSPNTKDEFIEYLEGVKNSASIEHIAKVKEVYGESRLKPFTTLFTYKNSKDNKNYNG